MEIERISAPSTEHFHREYTDKSRPVIITDLLTEWPAVGKWTPAFFAEHYDDAKVPVICLDEDRGHDPHYLFSNRS